VSPAAVPPEILGEMDRHLEGAHGGRRTAKRDRRTGAKAIDPVGQKRDCPRIDQVFGDGWHFKSTERSHTHQHDGVCRIAGSDDSVQRIAKSFQKWAVDDPLLFKRCGEAAVPVATDAVRLVAL
jgi:hypothetical protein